jgi:hypothetical protein
MLLKIEMRKYCGVCEEIGKKGKEEGWKTHPEMYGNGAQTLNILDNHGLASEG